MKKLLLFTIFTILTSAHLYTQVYGQSVDIVTGINMLQNYPNPFKELTTIKFNLKEDSYVKLFVVNQQTGEQTLLIEGELSAGGHGVIFKAFRNMQIISSDYKCVMEVYSLTISALEYSEIKMTQK